MDNGKIFEIVKMNVGMFNRGPINKWQSIKSTYMYTMTGRKILEKHFELIRIK